MTKTLNRWWNRCQQYYHQNQLAILVGILSGILTGTSYIPFFPWAILFNFAPLWWYWFYKATSRKQILLSGFLTQFIFNLIGFHWVFHTAHEFGHIPLPLSFIVLLLFAALAHLYVPLVGLIFFEIKSKLTKRSKALANPTSTQHWGLLITLCGLWCLAEIYWPYIFQWHMGYTLLWAKFPLFHLADVIGFQGLALILLLFNGFMVFWMRNTTTALRFIKGFSLSLIIFVLMNVGGWYHGNSWTQNYKPTHTVNFLPVQANIGNQEKIMAERGLGAQDFIVDRFIELSEQALAQHPEAQILVWPESAIPDYLDQEYSHRKRPQKIKKFLAQGRKGLITGAYSKELQFHPTTNGSNKVDDRTYNALFAFNTEGNLTSPPYRKHQLLAFGEYTPFAKWFPYLNEISPAGEGFDIGPGPGIREHSLFKFAPQLCYEALYPEDNRLSVLLGAQILINLTNDSWFGSSFEPYQHLSMTFARAIENRRSLLRVTNTGITSAIDATGTIAVQSPLFQEWSEIIPLSYEDNPSFTLFTRYGGFLPLFVLLITLGGLMGAFWKRK